MSLVFDEFQDYLIRRSDKVWAELQRCRKQIADLTVWRRIEDSQPDEYETVMLLLEHVGESKTTYLKVSGRWQCECLDEEGNGYFIDWCDERIDLPPHNRISHWLPIPTPSPSVRKIGGDHE